MPRSRTDSGWSVHPSSVVGPLLAGITVTERPGGRAWGSGGSVSAGIKATGSGSGGTAAGAGTDAGTVAASPLVAGPATSARATGAGRRARRGFCVVGRSAGFPAQLHRRGDLDLRRRGLLKRQVAIEREVALWNTHWCLFRPLGA